jgi:hypothetical protein
MEFISSRPDVVRSINQRWLLTKWNEMRAASPLPCWKGMETKELAAMGANLYFCDVVEDAGRTRFLTRYRGKLIVEAFGKVGERRYLDEILPPLYRDAALATYTQVLVTRLPVYTVAEMNDRNGRVVHYERLLLPFGSEGSKIDRILASLEAVSPDGAFENRDLVKSAPKPPAFALCTTIRH